MTGAPALLRRLFDAAVARAAPARVVPPALPPAPRGRTLVVGAGKAAAAMAAAVEAHWAGPLSGLVVTRYGHAVPTRRIEVEEAGHPLPDSAGTAAARRILELAAGLGEDDLMLALISGGGSSLLALPAPGLTLADKQAVGRALLRSGATIAEINCVRRQLSAIKGGQLAAAAFPAATWTLAISDVPGDDPATIASGPTVGDPTGAADAMAVLARRGIVPPPAVAVHLAARRESGGNPAPGDPYLARSRFRLVATPADSLAAAAAAATAEGLQPVVLGDALQGEARQLAAEHAGLAGGLVPGQVLLSGGETAVTVSGNGRGGRNAEYLLALGIALARRPGGHPAGLYALACDTDGLDGTEDNAGALLRPDSLARARAQGIDAESALADNDAYGFFCALDDLVVTGPTHTNVNDFRAVLATPA